ncbi:hypothetical protein B0A55_10023, partial [Friedmanniomyces simplex]
MVKCTAAPLLQIGRKLGTGNAGPFIGYTGTGTNGSSGEGPPNPPNVQSVVAAGHPYSEDGRIPGQHGQDLRSRDVDGISMESDNSQKVIFKKTVEQDV